MRCVLWAAMVIGMFAGGAGAQTDSVPTVFTFDGDGSAEILPVSRDVLNLTVTARTPSNEPAFVSRAPDGLGVTYGPGGNRTADGESLIFDFGETEVALDEIIVSVIPGTRIRMLVDAGVAEVVLRIDGPDNADERFLVYDLSRYGLTAARFQVVPVAGTGPAGHGIRLHGMTVKLVSGKAALTVE